MNRPFLKTGFANSFRKFFSSFNDLKSLSENRIVFIPSDLISYFKILIVLLILKCIFLSYVMCFVNLKLSTTSPITWPSKSWIFAKIWVTGIREFNLIFCSFYWFSHFLACESIRFSFALRNVPSGVERRRNGCFRRLHISGSLREWKSHLLTSFLHNINFICTHFCMLHGTLTAWHC